MQFSKRLNSNYKGTIMSDQVYPATIDDVYPNLRPMVREFLAKCNYPFTLELGGYSRNVDGVAYRVMVKFNDPAYPNEPAGSLRWGVHTGKSGKVPFSIISRHTLHSRYKDSERCHSVQTTNEKKVVGLMMQHIKPYLLPEIANKSWALAREAERKWRDEYDLTEFDSFNISRGEVYKEFQNLLAQGATFGSPHFRAAAETGVAKFDAWTKRQKMIATKWYVGFHNDGGVSLMDESRTVSTFASFETLPQFAQESVGMLRMMGTAKTIPGVGVRVSDNAFWVLKIEDVD